MKENLVNISHLGCWSLDSYIVKPRAAASSAYPKQNNATTCIQLFSATAWGATLSGNTLKALYLARKCEIAESCDTHKCYIPIHSLYQCSRSSIDLLKPFLLIEGFRIKEGICWRWCGITPQCTYSVQKSWSQSSAPLPRTTWAPLHWAIIIISPFGVRMVTSFMVWKRDLATAMHIYRSYIPPLQQLQVRLLHASKKTLFTHRIIRELTVITSE